jgi:hypothetical protein
MVSEASLLGRHGYRAGGRRGSQSLAEESAQSAQDDDHPDGFDDEHQPGHTQGYRYPSHPLQPPAEAPPGLRSARAG